MAQSLNAELYNKARRSIVGGVNSPVRDFGSVDILPIYIRNVNGPYIYDAKGNEYIDLLMSWGANILGHCDQDVNEAVIQALNNGSSFGLCHENEAVLAELIKQAFPSIELLRMVNSGTEAVMTAVRLARAYTGREKIIKFEGCYHGHSNDMLVKAGSGLQTLSIPASKGVTKDSTNNTLTAQFNDLDSVEKITEDNCDEIAAVIVEPVAGNMGVTPPEDGFLQGLRRICDDIGAILIFDEVITGFRIALGGAQEKYKIKPDITTLGKIIGGGFPFAALGGKKEIMEMLAPIGQVYQAGTLSGNPIAVAAGKAVIEKLIRINPYNKLEEIALDISEQLLNYASRISPEVKINRIASMFSVYFSQSEIKTKSDLNNIDNQNFKTFYKSVFNRKILLPPSPFESCFVSLSHLTVMEKIKTALWD
jgi:glutamate-1-semialdehyde 2,1-aminomutase